jgi:hypothetical protein
VFRVLVWLFCGLAPARAVSSAFPSFFRAAHGGRTEKKNPTTGDWACAPPRQTHDGLRKEGGGGLPTGGSQTTPRREAAPSHLHPSLPAGRPSFLREQLAAAGSLRRGRDHRTGRRTKGHQTTRTDRAHDDDDDDVSTLRHLDRARPTGCSRSARPRLWCRCFGDPLASCTKIPVSQQVRHTKSHPIHAERADIGCNHRQRAAPAHRVTLRLCFASRDSLGAAAALLDLGTRIVVAIAPAAQPSG